MSDKIVCIRVPEEMVDTIKMIASKQNRSFAGQVRHIIDTWIENKEDWIEEQLIN